MSKPTEEELLICLKCQWDKKPPSNTDCPGDCLSKRDAIRSLIECYGDGGPKITYRMLENAVIEIRLSRPEVSNMALVLKLKDALERRGVEVEEEKHG